MGVFKRHNDWWIDHYVEGRRKREKIGSSKKLAESVLAKRKVEIAEGKFLEINRKPKVRFEDFAQEYLEFSKTNKRSWQRDYASMKDLKAAFGSRYILEITPLMIEQYKARRKDQVTPATVNPAKKVKLFREDGQKRLRYLSEGEIEKLLEVALPHLKPIIITALHTGMRKGEILGLKWKNVNFRRGHHLGEEHQECRVARGTNG